MKILEKLWFNRPYRKDSMNKLRNLIGDKEWAIKMYYYDVWGSSASSNVDKIRELESEIEKIKLEIGLRSKK